MKRMPPIAFALAATLAARGAAVAAEAPPALRFPVVDAAHPVIRGPSYVGDRLELRLSPAAAQAAPNRAVRVSARKRPRLSSLGVAGVDRVSATLGAWLEPEFAGESPPAPGSSDPDFTTFYIVHLPPGVELADALARYRASAGVASADPIGLLPVNAVPNDSLWSISWWYDQASGHDIHATSAWDVTTGDSSITVAILDTGVLPYHPDLGGTVAGLPGQIWTNWAERGGTPGVDDDGNGFVDDTWGWDFVNGQSVIAGEDGVDEDNDPNDFAGHGTAVAGLIGAMTDNTIGVSGTAWRVRLMAVRVAWSDPGLPLGVVDMSYAAQGIRYATRMGASVINCSFATLNQAGLYAAADAATRAGVTIVAASGNGGQPHELADREDVVAVAATDINDQVAGYSNLGPFVDLCAPGGPIASTFVMHTASDSIGERQPAYTTTMLGTSFAAPQVAGAVALMQAHQKQLGAPPLTPMAAILRLRETADDISAENPGVAGYGAGRLDLYRALTDPPGSRVFRAGAGTIGPPVILPSLSGNARIAMVTDDQHLVIVNAITGDTTAIAALGGTPARQLASANLGAGRGEGLFVGTTNGKMLGFDDQAMPLPGWPKNGGGALNKLDGGPALGDLDGDGYPEIVCGGSDGNVYAWHADGTPVAGYPVFLDPSGVDLAVALAPIDTVLGVRIVAMTNSGDLHVLDPAGNEVPGWPQSVTGVPVAPMVTLLGSVPRVAIIAAAGTGLHAYAHDGTPIWNAALPGSVLQDLAAADLDLDGSAEILVPTFAPATLAVFDSAGSAESTHGFPVSLPAVPGGPLVVGPLRPGGRRAALLYSGGGLIAYTDSAAALQRFPEPGGAGVAPEIAELEADGQSEIAAGSGVDSLLFIYAAGANTWVNTRNGWLAPRANDARTGTSYYTPNIAIADDVPPGRITNLTATWSPPDSIVAHWTASGDNGYSGTAASYELRVTTDSTTALDFAAGSRTDLPAPHLAGTPERFPFQAASLGTRFFLAIRAKDAAGNIGAGSNVAPITTPGSSGLAVNTLALRSAGDSTLTLQWSAPPGVWYYDLRGSTTPMDAGSYFTAPLRIDVLAAGAPIDTAKISSLEPGSTWWFALRPIDLTGNAGPVSNVMSAGVPVGGALHGKSGVALAVRGQPARIPAWFDWQGGGAGIRSAIDLYDLSGRHVRTIELPGGRFGGTMEWNGRDDDQRLVPAGLYFARLTCGSIHAQARVVLLP